jgi:hypothetical protein
LCEHTRAWLARGLAAGEAQACRGWLDMAVRLTAILQGRMSLAVYGLQPTLA